MKQKKNAINNKPMTRFIEYLKEDAFDDILNVAWTSLVAALGFLAAIKGNLHLMWSFMIVDLALGITKSIRVDKGRFKTDKFMKWCLYVLIMTVLVSQVYWAETSMGGEKPIYYKLFIIIIIAVAFYSALINAEAITEKYIFTVIKDYLNEKVIKHFGIDLSKYIKREERKKENEQPKD